MNERADAILAFPCLISLACFASDCDESARRPDEMAISSDAGWKNTQELSYSAHLSESPILMNLLSPKIIASLRVSTEEVTLSSHASG